jgi:protein-L-isoaspartate(D-aspartate) O-methyltransferase
MNLPFENDPFNARREEMVRRQLTSRGIHDIRILAAMRDVPRHEFVPEGLRDHSYEDHPLPIGAGQTISQPYIVAAMLQHLTLQSTDRVLEVGTGSGYATALLSRLCAEVYSAERHADLAESAAATIARLGFSNVKILVGDGYLGWPEHAPFDAILVSAAALEIPSALFVQLREQGRMIAPIGPPERQELHLIRKANGKALTQILEGCRFVPLVGEQK